MEKIRCSRCKEVKFPHAFESGMICDACRVAKRKAYYSQNRAEMLTKAKAWQATNKARLAANKKRLRAEEFIREQHKLCRMHAAELKATYDNADWQSHFLGEHMEVRHIVPLRGRIVCGLHVPWNLRIVSASDPEINWKEEV